MITSSFCIKVWRVAVVLASKFETAFHWGANQATSLIRLSLETVACIPVGVCLGSSQT